ncbi:PAS domain S-box-containing protein/diguanylate cyclase (GGDEF) domain-containing protein [Pseudomonas linyingensis]|uniref:PAS domain S-box-containing protein/diguanylate cyclase (GGDEF) domain-containing protein n=1 Tax=Pseudomonas linyingensis TaxID=915471 RepID=A0A1H6W6K7_9PSED|nr:diguanylate cyclase [Pseudomonas linyingensis]SEJ07915.1 PAS domain S-box-containing protein/diguanylate cyclase (GGDEF) domain-containing protein [Pseudomonas linyingensis]
MPAPHDASPSRCSRRCQWLLCCLLTLVGLALTALLARQLWQDSQAHVRHQFEHLAEERFARLDTRLKERQRDLDSVRRLFENSGEVTRAEFEQYTQPLLSDNLALSWAPLLQLDAHDPDAQLHAFTQHAEALVGSHFRLREADHAGNLQPLQARDRYFPLLFSVSRSIAELPLGLDMASPGPRRDALEEAINSQQIGASAILRFTSGAEEDRLGLLLVAPVRAAASTQHARVAEAPLLGALFSAISLRQLLDERQATLGGLALELHDLEQAGSPPLYRLGSPVHDSPLQASRELRSGHWHYRLVLRPTARFLDQHPSLAAWSVALPGASLSLLLGLLLFVLLSQRQRALALVERRTAELQRNREALRISEERWTLALDGIGDGVWDWDLQSDRLYFSPTWKALLGYAEDEIGDSPQEWRDRLHPEDAARCEHALHECLAGRTSMYRCEKRLRCKDGSWLWLLARGKVVERRADGQPLRMIGTHVDISRRKTLELELRQSNARLQRLLEAASQVAIIGVSADGLIRTFNAGAQRLLGYERGDIQQQPVDPLLDGPQLAASAGLSVPPGGALALLEALLDPQHQHRELETILLRRNRTPLHVTLMLSAIIEPDGQRGGYLLIALDIGERLRARQALEERSQLLEKLGAQVPGSIFQYRLFADGHSCFPYASAGIREVYEVEPEQVRGDASAVIERIHPLDRQRIIDSIQQSARELTRWQEDYRVQLPQRGLRWLRGESVPERLADGSVLWHGFIADISSLKQVEHELRTLTITDPLTGIHNRRYFLDHLDIELERRTRTRRPLSLVMLDIDHFKRVNDTWGHDAGDQVLQELCRRIGARLRRIDMFCRLGGEEFVIICPETEAGQAAHLAEALRQLVQDTPFAQVGAVTASFGVSSARPGDSHESLLLRADQALYAAKDAGRNRVCSEPQFEEA